MANVSWVELVERAFAEHSRKNPAGASLPVTRPDLRPVGGDLVPSSVLSSAEASRIFAGCAHTDPLGAAVEAFIRWSAVPPLAERYAAFREAVERVVREEAPRAKVWFDYAPAWHDPVRDRRVATFLAMVDIGTGKTGEYACDIGETIDEDLLREWIGTGLRKLGARAMGATP